MKAHISSSCAIVRNHGMGRLYHEQPADECSAENSAPSYQHRHLLLRTSPSNTKNLPESLKNWVIGIQHDNVLLPTEKLINSSAGLGWR